MKNAKPAITAIAAAPPANGRAEPPPPDGSVGPEDSPAATVLPVVDDADGSFDAAPADAVVVAEDEAVDVADALGCAPLVGLCDGLDEWCDGDDPDDDPEPPLPEPPDEWLGEGELAFGNAVLDRGATDVPDDVEKAQPSRPPTVTCRVPAPSLLYDQEPPSVACQYDQ
jgi:hypothetical protein